MNLYLAAILVDVRAVRQKFRLCIKPGLELVIVSHHDTNKTFGDHFYFVITQQVFGHL